MSAGPVQVLIPAAGRGTRFGGDVLKQYLPICGKAVLAHAIRSFQFHHSIDGITVVISEDDHWFESALGSLTAAVETAPGGYTRAESVRNGLRSISERHPETRWVLVHDAARPCLPPDCLAQLLEQGMQHKDGAILAVPVGDTLKRADEKREIITTVDRESLWSAQTPQLFRIAELSRAMDAAIAANHELTDEASAMELAGASPKLVMGSAANVKITHPGDIKIAEAWLRSSGAAT